MADEARESIHIEASPEQVYAVAIDYERYPEWATDVKEVEVTDRDPEGRGTSVKYKVSALGRPKHGLERRGGNSRRAFGCI